MTTRDEIVTALASARTLQEQVELAAELESYDQRRTASLAAERSLDWADTTVRETLRPARVFEHHTAATDWLSEADLSGGDPHQKVMAEAASWFNRLHTAVKADAEEFVEQARGMARRTASRYGEAADSAERSFLEYVAFLNRQHLAASGLPQVQQLVDAFEKPAQTPLPQDVFDNFAPPVHPINEPVTGTEQNSLAPGAQEAMSEGGTPAGRPSEHDEDGDFEGQPHGDFEPRSAGRKTSAALERARDVTARRGHAMTWAKADGPDGWHGVCNGCGSSLAVIASGIVDGTAHQVPCGNRSHASLDEPTVAIGYQYNLGDFIRAQAGRDDSFAEDMEPEKNGTADDAHEEQDAGYSQGVPDTGYTDWMRGKQSSREAGGAAPFVREAASGLPQIQQVTDVHDQPSKTSLPTDVMFPVVQPWPETSTEELLDEGGEDTGPTNRPRQAARKQADMFGASDTPHAVPGGSAITGPENNPPARPGSHVYGKGFADGQKDAQGGQRPAFADNSSSGSPYVKGYVEGFNSGVQQGGGIQDVPVSMGGDNGQAASADWARSRQEQPLSMSSSKAEPIRLSARLLTKDVSGDKDFQRGYRWARQWTEGNEIVAVGSKGEEAGIYAGITDNPAQQRAWLLQHKAMAETHPELNERLRSHAEVTRRFAAKDPDVVTKGLYVQAGTTTDLDTMSPTVSPDPQGSTPSEGPGSIPPLRDAPGTPAAPGGPSPYNGAEPLGTPATPDPMMPGDAPMSTGSPDAVNMTGDSSLGGGTSPKMMAKLTPEARAFRQRVQQSKLALRHKKEN